MHKITTIRELRSVVAEARGEGKLVGFVPTMGYLHEGHASLMRRSREENGFTVLSIFVNPLQFGPNEDFERYPRDPERDFALAEANGVDAVFIPDVSEMYPGTYPIRTLVKVAGVTESLCGASRPGHFDGVSTVVAKLFHIVKPDRAYFGMKDAQQVAVLEQMVQDLNMDIELVPCPIVREEDGLAMSSRNVYLSPEERKQALVLSQSLRQAEEWLREEGGQVEAVKAKITEAIQQAPLADIDYVELVDYPSLKPIVRYEPGNRLLAALAVRFGKTRLIDNRLFESL